ncbi:hypothetical protein [Mangrovactinospora gilvigrisea]|nr:hypothetical protein [Mangrovactinospora gilvigrisea]
MAARVGGAGRRLLDALALAVAPSDQVELLAFARLAREQGCSPWRPRCYGRTTSVGT